MALGNGISVVGGANDSTTLTTSLHPTAFGIGISMIVRIGLIILG